MTGNPAHGGGDSPDSARSRLQAALISGEVGEGLREVAQRLAGRADLLGEQAHVVGVGEHLFEDVPALIDAAGPGQRLDVPERAQVERALAAGQPVRAVGLVAPDQAVADQFLADPVQGGQEPRVASGRRT